MTQNRQAAPRAIPIDQRLAQIEEARNLAARPYRHGGREGWTPGDDGPILTVAQRAEWRRAEYARLRGEGVRTPEAARLVGISVPTAYAYNRLLKAARLVEAEPEGGAS